MRITLVVLLIAQLALPAFAADPPKSEEEKTFYAIGLVLARQIAVFNLKPEELEIVKLGFADGAAGKTPAVDAEAYTKKIQELVTARRAVQGEKLAGVTKELMDAVAKEKGAIKTDSGLIYVPLQEGSGAKPAATETVKVQYRGTLADGKEFDSSYKRGQPAEFPLNKVIKCWTEGVQMMKVGGKAKLVCPPGIAYGDKGAGQLVPPNATLVFEVELLDIKK